MVTKNWESTQKIDLPNKDKDIQVCKYLVSRQNVITLENITSNIQKLKPLFLDNIKDLYIGKAHDKSQLVI